MFLEKEKEALGPALHWLIFAEVEEIGFFNWLVSDQISVFPFVVCQRYFSLFTAAVIFLDIVEISHSYWFWDAGLFWF